VRNIEDQCTAIARALLRNPRLLLMDEPLTGLDLRARNEILPFIERLHAELSIPVLYVSHAPDEVARLADHLVLLDKGRIIATGPIDDMLTRLDLPLAHGDQAEALVEAVVAAHDDEFGLTLSRFSGRPVCCTQEESESR
jgi:molybdate transport system ATP-binding protein